MNEHPEFNERLISTPADSWRQRRLIVPKKSSVFSAQQSKVLSSESLMKHSTTDQCQSLNVWSQPRLIETISLHLSEICCDTQLLLITAKRTHNAIDQSPSPQIPPRGQSA